MNHIFWAPTSYPQISFPIKSWKLHLARKFGSFSSNILMCSEPNFHHTNNQLNCSHMLNSCGKLSVKWILKYLLQSKEKYRAHWFYKLVEPLRWQRDDSEHRVCDRNPLDRDVWKSQVLCIKYWKCWHLKWDEGINRIRRA